MSLSFVYRVGGAALGIAGILVVLFGGVSDATYAPAVGIAVFAVLYVIAQAVERLVEWVTEGLKLIPDSPGARKTVAVRALREANSTMNGNPDVADFAAAQVSKATNEEAVEEARTDVLFLGHGLSILLSAIAVNALNYGIMGSLGASNVNADVDRLLTALAAAGGSKGLHELIGRVQASKENAQTSA